MKDVLKNEFPISTIQRAGYVAENILFNNKLTNIFENKLSKLKLKPVLLKSSGKNIGDRDDKWKVIINTQIESDI